MELLIWLALGLSVWALRDSRRVRTELRQLREQVEDLLARSPAARAAGGLARAAITSAAAQPSPLKTPETLETPGTAEGAGRSADGRGPGTGAPQGPPAPPSGPGSEAPAAINWEQWVGVRGAAVVGGAVLALAGILFFKYSVEHDLLPPPVRVAFGVLTGLACLVAGLRLPRERYAITGDALVGGGLVALYAAFWAAHVLYHLIGVGSSSALLALTTVASGVLAVRLQARLVAVLGLVGGFVTPLLLNSGHASPIGLFGYILLLDAGVMVVARRLWPPLAVLSLVGTVLYQFGWVVFAMQPGDLGVALAVLTVFALLYLVASPRRGARAWWQTQVAAVLLPFLGALYLAGRADMGEHFYPFGGMLLLLDGGVLWMGRRAAAFGPALDAAPWEPRRSFISMAAAANVAVFATWAARNMRGDAAAWEGLGIACAMAAVFCAAELWERRRPRADAQPPFHGARLVTCGLFVVTPFACIGNISYWPMVAAWGVLSLLAAWLGNRPGQERLQTLAGGSLAAALAAARWAQVRALPGLLVELGAVWLGIAVLWSFLAQARRDAPSRDAAERAVLAFLCMGLACFADTDSRVLWGPLPAVLLAYGVLGAVGLAAASRSGAGGWGLAVAVACAWAQGWAASVGESFASADPQQAGGAGPGAALALSLGAQLVTLALFTLWPFFAGARAQASRWTWYTAAAASPLHLVPLLLTVRQATDAADGAVAVALGACSLAALRALRGANVPTPLLRGATAWIAAAALGMVSVALPLQLEDEWLLIGWALEGLAVTELWVRLEHRALKVFAAALFICVGARLLIGADEVYRFHAGGAPVLNFLMYTYWVPTLSLIGAAWRAQAAPAAKAQGAKPVFAPGCMLAGLAVLFVWINLCIAQAYGTEHTLLSLAQGGGNALHLTQSVAWAVYGLLILAAGVRAASVGLRWVSLGLLMVTAAKVFLFDLGDLEDLYRVASLVGLALSLITVSLCYQRFVFAPLREKKP